MPRIDQAPKILVLRVFTDMHFDGEINDDMLDSPAKHYGGMLQTFFTRINLPVGDDPDRLPHMAKIEEHEHVAEALYAITKKSWGIGPARALKKLMAGHE